MKRGPAMKNPALAKKLEDYIMDLPDDYGRKVIEISNSPRMREFSGAIVDGIDGVKAAGGGKSLNAMHIMGVFVAIIGKMVETNWLHSDILAALDLIPEYLNIIVSDARIRQEAVMFFDGEMGALRRRVG